MTIVLLLATMIAAQHQHPVMGFDQDRTTHHFKLARDGGAIEIVVKDPADRTNLAAIRSHLKAIVVEFSRGDFSKPFATHGEEPPGVKVMQARKSAMTFRYEQLRDGGRVVITTADEQARSALYEFLRYQIREHATGDPVKVPNL